MHKMKKFIISIVYCRKRTCHNYDLVVPQLLEVELYPAYAQADGRYQRLELRILIDLHDCKNVKI